MDVAVVMLPMPVLWGLQMAVGKKITLSSMFGLGIMYGPLPSNTNVRKICANKHLESAS